MKSMGDVRLPGERRHKNRLDKGPRNINEELVNKIRSLISIGDVPIANLFFKTQLKINLFFLLDVSFIYPFKKFIENIICFFK